MIPCAIGLVLPPTGLAIEIGLSRRGTSGWWLTFKVDTVTAMLLCIVQLASDKKRLLVRLCISDELPRFRDIAEPAWRVQVGPLWPATFWGGCASPLFSLAAMNQAESWGPFVIVHPDPLEPIQEECRYTFPPRRDSRQTKSSPSRQRAPSRQMSAIKVERCVHQDNHPEADDEIIDMYAAGWKAPRKAPEPPARAASFETHNSDPTPLTSSWDDSSDDESDTDTLTPTKNKWRKAVNVAKGRLKQMRSKENLLDLPGLRKNGSDAVPRSPQTSIPLVRISSVSKLERHYGYTSPELQKIGIDASCRVSEKSWSSGRWG